MKRSGKKLLWFSATAVLCVCLALMAGCGGDDNGAGGMIDGTQDPSTVQSEKVTAAQWAAAFDFDNVYNITVKINESYVETNEKKGCAVYKFDGDKMHYAQITDGDSPIVTNESYQSKENGVYYRYNHNAETQTWRREQADMSDDEWGVAAFLFEFEEFADAYELFSYDTGKKAYTYKMTRDNNHFAFAVKLVGGKL
ncbi:MAG: hypothetical protein K2L51_00680, partial [Clostridiales bacterium]|nr:hypothetical protein [Clostridiales bacterium]